MPFSGGNTSMRGARKLLLITALFAIVPFSVHAQRTRPQPEEEEEDEGSELTPDSAPQEVEPARAPVEVARGFFVQTDPGVFDYLGRIQQPDYLYSFGDALSMGPAFRLHVGADLITRERFGVSAQATFWQVVNNLSYDPNSGIISPAQGDTRSFLYEVAVRPTLLLGSSGRLNVYGRVGLGVGFLQQAVEEVREAGVYYGSFEKGLVPKPFFSGGAGIEYYTRLSHFSVTLVEVNALYMTGVDIGLGISFLGLKYTF